MSMLIHQIGGIGFDERLEGVNILTVMSFGAYGFLGESLLEELIRNWQGIHILAVLGVVNFIYDLVDVEYLLWSGSSHNSTSRSWMKYLYPP